MTRAKNLFNQVMFPYCCYSFLPLLLLVLLSSSDAAAATYNFHTIPLSSLLPQSKHSTCDNARRPLTGDLGGGAAAAIEVHHRDHPCAASALDSTPLSTAQILARDELRVRSIQARVSSKVKGQIREDAADDLPAEYGEPLDSGNYIVNVGIGTPATSLALVFDTGSPLTWTQCRPCATQCYPQKFPIFDPSKSTSYSSIKCSSPRCSDLKPYFNGSCSSSGTCGYQIEYADGSTTAGNFATERLSLTSSHFFKNFYFGCGQNNTGLFGNVSGLLGLSPNNSFSVVSQTANVYDQIFSYCLPTQNGTGGYLEFGNRGGLNKFSFTPLTSMDNDTSFYYIQLQSISVGGVRLPIKPAVFREAGMVIDSGTVVTRLPPDAYEALKTAFAMGMRNYTQAKAFSILDTCFDFSKVEGTITIPSIEFEFSENVKVNIPGSGILIPVDTEGTQCLAFAANKKATSVGVYGNMQQQTLDVVYDVKNWRLGFGVPGRCT